MALFTPIAGLWLATDSSPTSSTLTAKACLIDADVSTDCTGTVDGRTSVGEDLGVSKTVEEIIVRVITVTGNISAAGYYSTSNDTFEVYSSDDNAAWTLQQTFNAPTVTVDAAKVGHIHLVISSPFAARYVKVRADSGGWAQASNGEALRCTELESYGSIITVSYTSPALALPETFYEPTLNHKFVPAISAAETFVNPRYAIAYTSPASSAVDTFVAPSMLQRYNLPALDLRDTFNAPNANIPVRRKRIKVNY